MLKIMNYFKDHGYCVNKYIKCYEKFFYILNDFHNFDDFIDVIECLYNKGKNIWVCFKNPDFAYIKKLDRLYNNYGTFKNGYYWLNLNRKITDKTYII